MFGIIFIVIGGILLLQSFGFLGATLSGGAIWGIVLIVIGIALMVSRASRHSRRTQWMAERQRRRGERQGSNSSSSASDAGKSDTN